MKVPARNFDGLAKSYRLLEWLAFGRSLETARFSHLDALEGCQRVLILGEGDGRFLARLIRHYPELTAVCMDRSGTMLARAAGRLTELERQRVTFRHADALSEELGRREFDAVVTLFFLDCFREEEAAGLIGRIGLALREESRWVWADFALPTHGWRRWRAHCWLCGLYAFFRWKTGITARRLPPVERLIQAGGFRQQSGKTWQAGLVRSAVFVRQATGAGGPRLGLIEVAHQSGLRSEKR
jgi:SAM-dependent methyltransferase